MNGLSLIPILLSLAGIAIGCSGIKVSTDYDPKQDFSTYNTFDWMPEPESGAGYDLQGLVHTRVQTAIDHVLQERGFIKTADGPGLLVAYHTGKQQQTEIESWGYGWGGMGGVDTYTYDVGTLIVDFIDAKTKQLVWRGAAEGTLSDDPSSEEVSQNIDMVVEKILSKYPPN